MNDKLSNNIKEILENNVINIFFKKEEFRSLSNFWKSDIIMHDRIYDSGESCFHGEKFTRISELCEDVSRKRELLEYGKKFLKDVCKTDGSIVKKMGRAFTLYKDELELWQTIGIDVQREICKYKVENYKDVRDDLYKSGHKILIHPAMRCSSEQCKTRLWEGKAIVIDGCVHIIGKNMLGNIWMELRNSIVF